MSQSNEPTYGQPPTQEQGQAPVSGQQSAPYGEPVGSV